MTDVATAFYDQFSDQFPKGEGWQCAGWHSEKYQKALFKAAAMVGNLRTGGILDVGCGMADLYDYLDSPTGYVGIDVSSKIIARAKAKYPEADVRCIDFKDYDEIHDWVIAVGAFSVTIGSDSEQLKYLKDNIWRMLSMADKGVMLTFLSRHIVPADRRYKELFYYDPTEVFKICLELNGRVAIDHMADQAQCYVFMRTG